MNKAEIDAKNSAFRKERISEMNDTISELHDTISEMKKQLNDDRNYLMSVSPKDLTVEDALEAFGFGRNGLV